MRQPKDYKRDSKEIKEYASEPDKPKCKFFGCGKDLNYFEALYGDLCVKHSRVKNLSPQNLPDENRGL